VKRWFKQDGQITDKSQMSETELKALMEKEKMEILLGLEKVKTRFVYAGLFFDFITGLVKTRIQSEIEKRKNIT